MSTASTVLLIVIGVLLVIGMILIIRGLWESRHTIIDYAELHPPVGSGSNFIPRTLFMREGDANRGDKFDLRVLFFSDLHAEMCCFTAGQLGEVIRREHKKTGLDAVLFGGDIINDPLKCSVGIKYLSQIASVCDELGIPFYGVTGNHDVEISREDIDACGFTDLSRTYITLPSRLGTGSIAISGAVDTGRENRVWYSPAPVPETLDDGTPVLCNVLLAHNPDYILHLDELRIKGAVVAPQTTEYDADAVSRAQADASSHYDSKKITHVLAGHIHAGQIRTPIGIEFSLLRKDILPKKQKVIAGVYEGCGVSLFLSRGLGNIWLPLRIGARPEVTILEIYAR